MTKAQLIALINTLVNDNNAKEVSAKDVRDALEAVYDTSVLNGTPLTPAEMATLANITALNPIDLDALAANKVDKVTNMGLSTENFTTVLLDKLTNLEGSHFKGVHADLAALELAFPAAIAEAGSYAYLKDGANQEEMAILDDTGDVWMSQAQTVATPLTAVQIKALYESNVNTEGLTTTMLNAINALINNLSGIDTTTTTPNPGDTLVWDGVGAWVPAVAASPERGGTLHDPAVDYLVGDMVAHIDIALPSPFNAELRTWVCTANITASAWTGAANWDDTANGGTY